MTALGEPASAKSGRGGFFAVDRRAWHFVCGLGMNAAVAYLVQARGTGGDNRTTKWSAHAVEERTGSSRSRAQDAIRVLERAGPVQRDPASAPSRPKYKIVPAHEIPGCEGVPLPPLNARQERIYATLGTGWTKVPEYGGYQQWGYSCPHSVAEDLVKSGHAEKSADGQHFRAIRYDAEAAARPDWIWLPNELVDGAADEVPPVELIRQTGNVLTLRLLVNLYGSQILDENGGIHFRRIRKNYTRHKIGEQGSIVVWGFVPGDLASWPDSPFVAPHLAAVDNEAAWKDFWGCWNQLRNLGLVGFVGHLVHADTSEGEVIHPVALLGEGLEVERELGVMSVHAARALITEEQVHEVVNRQGVVMLAPIQRHIEQVQMVGIARLRYRPRTSRTQAFTAREPEWRAAIDRLSAIAKQGLATSRYHQG